MSAEWSVEEIDTLRKLYAEGGSAAEICRAMSPRFTRNAIIGKIHRLGLNGPYVRKSRANPAASRCDARSIAEAIHAIRRAKKKIQSREHDPIPSIIPVDPTVAQSPCSLMELTFDTCRWPFGDPQDKDFHYCGGLAIVDNPYCAVHSNLAFTHRR